MCSEVSFLKWKVIMNKSWVTVTVIYWKPALKFKSHSFVIHSRVCERTHDKRKQYFFNKLACATDVKSLKIHCGIPTFYYFHVLFFPCFFKLCPFFFPPTGTFPSEKPSSHVSPKAEGLSGPCSHQEGECPLVCSTAAAFPSPLKLPLWSRISLHLRKHFTPGF